MAYLMVENGPHAGMRHNLASTRMILGRHPECDIVVDVGAVSRHHAQLSRVGNQFFIEDLNSRNGTLLNNRLVQGRQVLRHGDRLRVCDISFLFQHPGEPVDHSTEAVGMVVDDDNDESTIMSRLDVVGDGSGLKLSASPEVKLKALLQISKSLGRTLSLDQVLPQVLESLFTIFVQADRGQIVLRDDRGNLIPRWSKTRHPQADVTIRISRTIVQRVLDSKQAILSADAASDKRFDMSQSVSDFHIRSMICAPLIDSDGKAFGVLQIDTMDRRKLFREEDLEVLASVATQASIAIENANLHESLLGQRELERDLQLARQVQQGILPEVQPQVGGYEFFHHYQPAYQIGGDYFDYIPLPDGRLALVVADVVGHGIAAALLMAKLSATVRFCLASEPTVSDALERVNATLGSDNLEGRFITTVIAVLQLGSGHLCVVNAGHLPPLVRRSDGHIEKLAEASAGLPLLVREDQQYEQMHTTLGPGETLLMFTDGIQELSDANGNQFGTARIMDSLSRSRSASDAGERLWSAVEKFLTTAGVADDICFVCVHRQAT
jgi:serine phosphatase RsbU (regulator of sigma subunit)/pSer/pThr/pTyr-binding forkhead associated (FHA) protein